MAKRRRLSSTDTANDQVETFDAAAPALSKPLHVKALVTSTQRKPLDVVRNPSAPLQGNVESCGVDGYYTVLWFAIL